MEKALDKLRETRGEIAIHLSIIVLAATLLVAAAMQVSHVYGVIDRVQDKTNQAVLSVAAANVARVFPGGRESDWLSLQHVSGSAWSHLVSTEEVLDALGISLSVPILKAESFTFSSVSTCTSRLGTASEPSPA